MKLTPTGAVAPAIQQTMSTTTNSQARANAIAKLTAVPTQSPVQNQNAIAPEEMGALIPKPKLEDAIKPETSEVQSTEQNSQPKEDPEISRQYAQLARQEKALRAKALQQEQTLKAREAALAAKEAELTGRQPDPSKYVSRDQLRQEALRLIDLGEIPYDEITNRALNSTPTDPRMEATISQLKQQIDELKQQTELAKKSQADQQTQAYQAAVKQITTDVKKLVFTDPNFETIKATNSVKDVVELIEETFKSDGYVMSVEDAANEVENYLIDEAMKITQIDKIKKRLGQNAQSAKPSAPTQSQVSQEPQQQQPTMRTLTNSVNSSRKLSAKERAVLAFKGELKTS